MKLPNYYKRGMSALELVVYVALLVGISLVSLDAVSVMSRSLVRFRTNAAVTSSASAILERIGREVRSATYLDDVGSTYNAASGQLILATEAAGATTTVEFTLVNGRVIVKENAGIAVPISGADVVVDSLLFRRAATSSLRLVKVELGLRSAKASSTAESFYTSAVVRGAY